MPKGNAMVRLAEGSIKCDQRQNKVEDRERPGISSEALALAEEKLRLL